MSLNKIIIIFIVILVIFGGFVIYMYANQAPKTAKVTIKEQTFAAEVASTSAELQKGLSGRDSLDENKAMLFVFSDKRAHSFWMNEMKFPLDLLFINDNKIVSITKNAPPPEKGQKPEDLKVYTPPGPVNRVLEVKAGLSAAKGFKPGDTVTIELPGASKKE